ncbi:hypothetical protein CK500_15345 [Halorubrum salipaludis]|uniref:CSD domain-containing protein n=1 Tax=Halorubrum salipaludis TaxID=2032630 RepID=A0A2A2F6M4_9EURY|nr:cold shock domain-containing protein [Halorubrum salipaludis]PAU80242.1 hypothetical protein CK500_15345 [Halorubrum salipaludis]
MQKGKIKAAHQRRSYGYISPKEEAEQIYFHFEDFDGDDIQVEKKVIYQIETTSWGKRAFNVELV